MSQYRRCYQPGGNYFFTLVTYQRRPLFNRIENIEYLKLAFNTIKKKYPYTMNALVILPDHLHCIWQLPNNDADFSTRWRLIKRYFSSKVIASVNHRQEKEVWQRRFWEHVICSEKDWQKHLDYIHYNPVKHGLVRSPGEWRYSSFNYWVKKGIYEKNWGAVEPVIFAGMKEME